MKAPEIVQNIAIANGFCVVTDIMRLGCIGNVAPLAIKPVHGYAAYHCNSSLYLVAFGKDGWLESDNINALYGEENVIIHDYYNDSGCIFEVKNW